MPRLPSITRIKGERDSIEEGAQDRSWVNVQARRTAEKRRHLTSSILQ